MDPQGMFCLTVTGAGKVKNSNWRDRFSRWMAGRYGEDELSRFLLIVSLILLVVNMFVRGPVIGTIVFALLIWVYFRMFSRNITARWKENQKYLQIRDRVKGFFHIGGADSSSSADYHIYRCPKCGQKIRIPKGHGKVEITCPKCRTRFRKRT